MKYPFTLVPLPYNYDALEPYIDTKTVYIHHNRHQKTYVENLNNILEANPQYQTWSLEELLSNSNLIDESIRQNTINNAGGVYCHTLYFSLLQNATPQQPQGYLHHAIKKNFGSFEQFAVLFSNQAKNLFGSGWVWLVVDLNGNLKIISTHNQDVPDLKKYSVLLLIDVWEHAYYLKYQNLRTDYIYSWFKIINWQKVEQRYPSWIN